MVPIFTVTTMRLRGGAGDANKDSKYNDVLYLTNINFKWNGLPTFDFDEKILFPLQNGLGSIALHKATLLDTALQKDHRRWFARRSNDRCCVTKYIRRTQSKR